MCKAFSLVGQINHVGQGKVILAKFESFLCHIINKHKNIPNKIFNKCHHEDLSTATSRVWLTEGKAYSIG